MKIRTKIIDALMLLVATIAVFLGFSVVIKDGAEEKPEPEKIVFYTLMPEKAQEQETDSYFFNDKD